MHDEPCVIITLHKTMQVEGVFDPCDEFPKGSVRVVYLDKDAERISYDKNVFLQAADIAPQHIHAIDSEEEESVLAIEQKAFVPQPRGELQPLQKKPVFTPTNWKKNIVAFDDTFGGRVNEQDEEYAVPVCEVADCKYDCKRLTEEIVVFARAEYRKASLRGVNERQKFLNAYARPSPKTVSPRRIWSHHVRDNVKPGRENWRCTFCKCNPGVVPASSIADTMHMFKKTKRRSSRFGACPDYDAGIEFKRQIIAKANEDVTRVSYYVPGEYGVQLRVHRSIFRAIFAVGWRRIGPTRRKMNFNHADGRKGKSGRKPFDVLRDRIDNFWRCDVNLQPSHYDSTSTTQYCVNVSSASHGWLMFMSTNFPDKYNECVRAQYFPGLTRRLPASLQPQDVPIVACDECIASCDQGKQVVCPHIPKFSFFKQCTSTFQLVFKRPGSDQCEKCNSLHDRIVVLRALGRQDEADAIEDRLMKHEEDLSNHHNNASAFRNAISALQHTSKTGAHLTKYDYDADVEWCSKDLVQSISMDAGSGLRSPFCRVGFAYFSRVLVTNVYHIVDHGTRDVKPYAAYLWNDKAGGKGPSECMSIFIDFITKHRTGAKRIVLEVDGCSGQIFNQYFFALSKLLTDPTSDICRCLGAPAGRPIFDRIDIFRGEVGHTFMSCDRVHGSVRIACRKKQYIANIDEHADIIRTCAMGRFHVTLVKAGDGFFRDIKAYVEQSFKLGGSLSDIDNNGIRTRDRHWANFGVGPSGGDNSVESRHAFGAWRLRDVT